MVVYIAVTGGRSGGRNGKKGVGQGEVADLEEMFREYEKFRRILIKRIR